MYVADKSDTYATTTEKAAVHCRRARVHCNDRTIWLGRLLVRHEGIVFHRPFSCGVGIISQKV